MGNHRLAASRSKLALNGESVPEDFPGGTVDKHPPASAEDTGVTLVREDSISCGATKSV